jgi:hypothetical protein
MNGAESLLRTLVGSDVEVCFGNLGTSEMHFVAALDRVEGMPAVLGLFEGAVTGNGGRTVPSVTTQMLIADAFDLRLFANPGLPFQIRHFWAVDDVSTMSSTRDRCDRRPVRYRRLSDACRQYLFVLGRGFRRRGIAKRCLRF